MKKSRTKVEIEDYERLNEILTYLLAGLAGYTDGNEIVSLTVQQADLSAFRVIIRARARDDSGDSVRLVGFANGSTPASALLVAEDGYRTNVIRWITDRFAASASDNGSSKIKNDGLTLTE